jgi:hypothetical protein
VREKRREQRRGSRLLPLTRAARVLSQGERRRCRQRYTPDERAIIHTFLLMISSLVLALENTPSWLSPYRPMMERILHATDSQSIAAALNASRDDLASSIRFVDQTALPAGEAYESFIARTSCVPTRDNLHDLFNGLMWLSYPQTKRRLNELQARQIDLHGTSGPRGPLRDSLTLFDENAAILQAPADLLNALRKRDWQTLFTARRAQWQSARLAVFGHALMEKLMQPRKSITAHVWAVADLTDDALASSLTVERLLARPFLPLPVLGVPGWWRENEAPGFYDDTEVFRPPRCSAEADDG